MIADPKSQALIDNFFGQWLQLRELKNIAPDPEKFPQFNDALRQSMLSETEMFVADLIRHDGSVLQLIDADYTFVNDSLAKHYGIDGIEGGQFRRTLLSISRNITSLSDCASSFLSHSFDVAIISSLSSRALAKSNSAET